MAGGVGVAQLGGGTEGGDRPLEGERELRGAGSDLLLGPADLGHVEVDADDSRWFSSDVGEDSLVGHQPVLRAVRVGQLEFLLHGPLRVSQQLAVGGVEALRQLGRPNVEGGLADDLTLGVARGHRIGLVLVYVAQRGIQAKDRHRDRLEELLEEVGALRGGLFGLP